MLDFFDNLKNKDLQYRGKINLKPFSLFMDINLDALEESDDEDEFENTSIDKFVYLDRKVVMKCVYVSKFKKWKPLSIIS